MTAENPSWRIRVEHSVPGYGTTAPIRFDQLRFRTYGKTGRPVLENEVDNVAGVPFEYVQGLKDGDRSDKLVNISSFEELMPVFPQILGLISLVRDTLHPYNKKTTPESITETLNTLIVLPEWLILRADNPIANGDLSTGITGAAKVARGFGGVYQEVELNKLLRKEGYQVTDPSRQVLTNSDDFLDYVYANHLLWSAKDPTTACPAPRINIVTSAKALFDEPSQYKEAVALELGLSPADIKRAAKYGMALSKGRSIHLFMDVLKSDTQSRFLFESDPKIDDRKRRATEFYYRTMNNVNKWMNEALGRDKPDLISAVDYMKR